MRKHICHHLTTMRLLSVLLLIVPLIALCQEPSENKYTPPASSPFGKDSRTPVYSSGNQNFKLLLGVPAISVLKGEAALTGAWIGRDFSATLKLGVPYKLNWFDFARFWDENLNLVDEMVDDRLSLKWEQKKLLKPIKGFCTGLGLRYLVDSDNTGFSFMELEYSLLTNKADFDTQYLLTGSDPAFKSIRHDFIFAFGKNFMLGNGDKFMPYIEESFGFGMGYLKATRLLTTNTYGQYETNGDSFNCLFPLLYVQLNIGLALLGK
jgi:hypothetical protein